jgi:glycosyltransferase involved in cell wall biosynthesis
VKRILHLIKGLGRGGAELLLLSATPYVDRDRFAYEVAYLLPQKSDLVMELNEAGIPVHCLNGGSNLGWLGGLRRLVKERGIDLVHSHSPLVAVGARLALWGPTRRVYTEHNVWECYHPITYWANLMTFPRSHYVLAVSEEVRASIRYPKILRMLPMPPRETLYHGLDPAAVSRWASSDGVRAELGIPEDAAVFGTVANFRPEKGHHLLLRATVRVRQEIPNCRLVLVGRGPLEDEIRREVRELGLDGTVVFAGHRKDAPRVAGGFDLFVLSSVHEGLALALIEAMSLGKPAVVTDVGGLPEVVEHNKHGFVVPAGDERALADGIVTLLRDKELRHRFGQAARERAADFDIRKAVRRMEEVYGELLG